MRSSVQTLGGEGKEEVERPSGERTKCQATEFWTVASSSFQVASVKGMLCALNRRLGAQQPLQSIEH